MHRKDDALDEKYLKLAFLGALVLVVGVLMYLMSYTAIINSQIKGSWCAVYANFNGLAKVALGNYTNMTLYFTNASGTIYSRAAYCTPTYLKKGNVTYVEVTADWNGAVPATITYPINNATYNYLPFLLIVFVIAGSVFRKGNTFVKRMLLIGVVLIAASLFIFFALSIYGTTDKGLMFIEFWTTVSASMGLYCLIGALVALLLNDAYG